MIRKRLLLSLLLLTLVLPISSILSPVEEINQSEAKVLLANNEEPGPNEIDKEVL